MKEGTFKVNVPNSNAQNRQVRRQFQAAGIQEAVSHIERKYFRVVDEVDSNQEISVIFNEWLEDCSASKSTVQRDYFPRVKMFTLWAEEQGLYHWGELKPKHLQLYANEGKEGRTKRTIVNRCRVVTWASEYAIRNYPDQDYPLLTFVAPKGKPSDHLKTRSTILLDALCEFLLFLRDERECGWNILPGVAVSGICSVRWQETRQTRFRQIDWENRLLTVSEGLKDGVSDHRTIPLPSFVFQILKDAAQVWNAKPRDFIMKTNNVWSAHQAFQRHLERFDSNIQLEPRGLRRTLRREFRRRHLNGHTLQLYRGHKPDDISALDWNHYLDKLRDEPDEILDEFREYVVQPVDEICKPYLDRWNAGKS